MSWIISFSIFQFITNKKYFMLKNQFIVNFITSLKVIRTI